MSGIRRYRRERTYPLHFSNPFYTTGFVDPSRTFESDLFFGDGITSLETRDALRDFQHMLERQNAGISTTYEGEMKKMLLNDKLHKQNAIANWLVQMISESEDMDGIPDDKQKIIINWSQQISNPIIREHVLQKLQEKLDKGRVKHIAQMTASKEPLSTVSEGENVPRVSQKAQQEQEHDARTEAYRTVKTEQDGTPPTQKEIDAANPRLAEPAKLPPETGTAIAVPTVFEQAGHHPTPTAVRVEQVKPETVAPPESAAAASLTYSHPDPPTETPSAAEPSDINHGPFNTAADLWNGYRVLKELPDNVVEALNIIRLILGDENTTGVAALRVSQPFEKDAMNLLFKAHRYNERRRPKNYFDLDFLRREFNASQGKGGERYPKRRRGGTETGGGMFKSFGLEDSNGIRWWR